MRYTYKELKYQEKAVTSVVDVFAGQHYVDKSTFPMEKKQKGHLAFQTEGFGNAPLALDSATLLKNIQNVQSKNGILESACLIQELGVPHLDIEMETGTGKTFVYTKTIFELNKKYGYQ